MAIGVVFVATITCTYAWQEALELRERAVDILSQVDVTSDSATITLVAQSVDSLISNPDQMSGDLMVRKGNNCGSRASCESQIHDVQP